jgi:hypothetical protein
MGCPARRFRGLERSTGRACSGRSRRSTCLYVGGGRGQGHIDRGGFVVWSGDRTVCSVVSRWGRSGLRVLAAHDQA